jgi:hypothetical protein
VGVGSGGHDGADAEEVLKLGREKGELIRRGWWWRGVRARAHVDASSGSGLLWLSGLLGRGGNLRCETRRENRNRINPTRRGCGVGEDEEGRAACAGERKGREWPGQGATRTKDATLLLHLPHSQPVTLVNCSCVRWFGSMRGCMAGGPGERSSWKVSVNLVGLIV